jgi:hypothetical protein
VSLVGGLLGSTVSLSSIVFYIQSITIVSSKNDQLQGVTKVIFQKFQYFLFNIRQAQVLGEFDTNTIRTVPPKSRDIKFDIGEVQQYYDRFTSRPLEWYSRNNMFLVKILALVIGIIIWKIVGFISTLIRRRHVRKYPDGISRIPKLSLLYLICYMKNKMFIIGLFFLMPILEACFSQLMYPNSLFVHEFDYKVVKTLNILCCILAAFIILYIVVWKTFKLWKLYRAQYYKNQLQHQLSVTNNEIVIDNPVDNVTYIINAPNELFTSGGYNRNSKVIDEPFESSPQPVFTIDQEMVLDEFNDEIIRYDEPAMDIVIHEPPPVYKQLSCGDRMKLFLRRFVFVPVSSMLTLVIYRPLLYIQNRLSCGRSWEFVDRDEVEDEFYLVYGYGDHYDISNAGNLDFEVNVLLLRVILWESMFDMLSSYPIPQMICVISLQAYFVLFFIVHVPYKTWRLNIVSWIKEGLLLANLVLMLVLVIQPKYYQLLFATVSINILALLLEVVNVVIGIIGKLLLWSTARRKSRNQQETITTELTKQSEA